MQPFYNSAYWRFRAEEARAIGEEMTDPGARETMFRLATNWEEIANRAEEQERIKAAS